MLRKTSPKMLHSNAHRFTHPRQEAEQLRKRLTEMQERLEQPTTAQQQRDTANATTSAAATGDTRNDNGENMSPTRTPRFRHSDFFEREEQVKAPCPERPRMVLEFNNNAQKRTAFPCHNYTTCLRVRQGIVLSRQSHGGVPCA